MELSVPIALQSCFESARHRISAANGQLCLPFRSWFRHLWPRRNLYLALHHTCRSPLIRNARASLIHPARARLASIACRFCSRSGSHRCVHETPVRSRESRPAHESRFARQPRIDDAILHHDDLGGRMPRDGATLTNPPVAASGHGPQRPTLQSFASSTSGAPRLKKPVSAGAGLGHATRHWRQARASFWQFFLANEICKDHPAFRMVGSRDRLGRKAGGCFGFSPSFSEWISVLANCGRF
jgi:hypothetical protein